MKKFIVLGKKIGSALFAFAFVFSSLFSPFTPLIPEWASEFYKAISIEATEAEAATASIPTNWNSTKQEMDGFGAAFVTIGQVFYNKANKSWVNDYLTKLFDTQNGIGLSIARVEITTDNHDAKDYWRTWINSIKPTESGAYQIATPASGTGLTNGCGTGYESLTDKHQVWLMCEAKRINPNIKFLASVWSPPPYMKTNNSFMGDTDDHNSSSGQGFLRRDKYTQFADYLATYVKEYKDKFGLNISHLSITNEPNQPTSYQGAFWYPSNGPGNNADVVSFLPVLDIALRSKAVDPAIVVPELGGWVGSATLYQEVWGNDANPHKGVKAILDGASQYVDVLAMHGYDQLDGSANNTVLSRFAPVNHPNATGKKVWQTELSVRSNQSNNPDSITAGLLMAENIHKNIVIGNASAWIYWSASAPTDWSAKLLAVDNENTTNFRVLKSYYSLGQFSKYIRPGFQRLDVSANPISDVYVSAYKDNSSGQLVYVIVNKSSSSHQLNFSLQNAPSGISSLTPITTSGSQNMAVGSAVSVSGGNFSYNVPASSIVTLVRFPGNVSQPDPAPIITLNADSAQVTSGQSTNIRWSVANSTGATCTATGGWSGTKSLSGSESTGTLTTAKTYTLTCNSTAGADTKSVTVNVTSAPSVPTATISLSSPSIQVGSSATLNWASQGATQCNASGASGWSGVKSTTGSLSVAPTSAGTYTYSISCSGAGGTSPTQSAQLIVTQPSNPSSGFNITIASPTAGATITKGTPVTLSSQINTVASAGGTDESSRGFLARTGSAIVDVITAPVRAVASLFGTQPTNTNLAQVLGNSLNINTNSRGQDIDGFGVAFAGMANVLWKYPEPMRSRIVDMLFDPTYGAGFSIMRTEPISGPQDRSDPLWNWADPKINSIQPTKDGGWVWDGDNGQVWLMQEAKKKGVNTFLATVWSPPAWMKSNNSHLPGTLKRENYQDFADYLSRYVREYKSRFGIDITHISPTNEPNFAANYQATDWTPNDLRDFVVDFLKPTLSRDGVTSKIVAAEVNNWSGTMGHVQPILDKSPASIDIVAGHGYEATPQFDYFTTAFNAGKKVWMTEDSEICNSGCNPGQTLGIIESDWAARNWYKVMHGYLTKAKVSGYVYWYGANFGWPGAGLMTSSAANNGNPGSAYPSGNGFDFKPRKALYGLAQVARFVRPGAKMLNINFEPNAGVYAMAFIHPTSGQLVITASNDNDETYTLRGNISGTSVTSLKPYVTETKGVKNVAPEPRISVSGGSFSYTIPKHGIVTLVKDEVQPPAPALNSKVYVSDLKASSMGAGWLGTNPVELDRTVGNEFGGNGSAINIAGTSYPKGLGVQDNSHITYYLGGRANTFSAVIGVESGSSEFSVIADGVEVYKSPTIRTSSGNGTRINVNVAGKQEIALVTKGDAKAIWADAHVNTGTTGIPDPQPPVDPTPQPTSTYKVEYFANGVKVGESTSDGYLVTWTPVVVGTNTITAKATRNSDGQIANSSPVSVVVQDVIVQPQPPAISSFTVSASSVVSGGSVTLNWASQNTTGCTASGAWSGVKQASGQQIITNLASNSVFSLSCTGTNGTMLQATPVSVSVTQAPGTTNSISITSPANGAVFTQGNPIDISATVSLAGANGSQNTNLANANGANGSSDQGVFSFLWNEFTGIFVDAGKAVVSLFGGGNDE